MRVSVCAISNYSKEEKINGKRDEENIQLSLSILSRVETNYNLAKKKTQIKYDFYFVSL